MLRQMLDYEMYLGLWSHSFFFVEFEDMNSRVWAARSGVCWGPLASAGEHHWCASIPESVFSDGVSVAWPRSWWEYVHNRNGQKLPMRIYCPWRAGCETCTCTWLTIDQTKIDWELKSKSKWLKLFYREMGIADHFVPINGLCEGSGFFPYSWVSSLDLGCSPLTTQKF